MLLHRLVEAHSQLCGTSDLVPMYKMRTVHWYVSLDSQGRLVGIDPLGLEKRKKGEVVEGKNLLCPHGLPRTSRIRPTLLVDTAEYVLGLSETAPGGTIPEDVRRKRCSFRGIVRSCYKATKSQDVLAVYKFLSRIRGVASGRIKDIMQATGFTPSGENKAHLIKPRHIVTFRVDDRIVVEDPKVQKFWSHAALTMTERDTKDTDGADRYCLVCGTYGPVVRIFPDKVSGIPDADGKSKHVTLSSANQESMLSYGLEQAHVGPICYDCAQKAATALQALIDDPRHHAYVGPVVYVFWTVPDVDNSASYVFRPHPEEVRCLITSYLQGELGRVEDSEFYAAALSAVEQRLVLRDWVETTVSRLNANVAAWFAAHAIVGDDGQERYLSVLDICRALYPDPLDSEKVGKEMPRSLPQQIASVGLAGRRLPGWLLSRAIDRARSRQDVTPEIAGIIKALLATHNNLTDIPREEMMRMTRLDESCTVPAYVCGRIFRVLEQIQLAALDRDVGATVTKRAFGSACTAPASIMPTLMRLCVAHLGKLKELDRNKHDFYETLLAGLCDKLRDAEGFPTTLGVAEQGLFCLGYYHQKNGG